MRNRDKDDRNIDERNNSDSENVSDNQDATIALTISHPSVENEKWFKTYWRPAMGWLYMLICVFDFILFPIGNMLFFAYTKEAFIAWKPITLDNGGLVHISFGTIIGVTAWTHAGEKRL